MEVLCVLNPLAADGVAVQRWPQVADALRALGLRFELLATERGALASQVCAHLEREGGRFDAVASIGGDGTHSGVVNGLMAYGRSHPDAVPTCTLIPLGTGNDIAKSFGIQIADQWSPRELRRAVATLVHGADYRMDLGCLGGRYFADALTIGLDSRILRARNEGRRRLARFPLLRRLVRGRLLYTLSTGRPFLSQVPVQTEITVDGRPWYTGPMINVVVNNTRIYAGAFDFSVDAYADDGRLDVVLFSGHTDYLARYLLSIRHNPERIRQLSERLSAVSSHTQGREIRIRVSRPEPAQMDGEELPDADGFDITVAPRAIRIKTPAEPV